MKAAEHLSVPLVLPNICSSNLDSEKQTKILWNLCNLLRRYDHFATAVQLLIKNRTSPTSPSSATGPESRRGFMKFQGVAENPTETIVNNLKKYVERRGLPPGVQLGTCLVLETAGDGALPMLYKVLESGTSKENSLNESVIWIHLGVDSGALKFAIERQAVNEATFCCPDELGWQPQQMPIVPGDGGITQTRKTSCSIEAILRHLKNKGHDVMTSDDAGRFVCNYVYYHSLRFAEQKGHKSLFVHVPRFSKIDEETQMQFTLALLEAVAATF